MADCYEDDVDPSGLMTVENIQTKVISACDVGLHFIGPLTQFDIKQNRM
jgi:hypothetical protein